MSDRATLRDAEASDSLSVPDEALLQPAFTLRYGGGQETEVYCGEGIQPAVGTLITTLPPRRPRRVILCSDDAVYALHGQALVDVLAAAGLASVVVTIPPGEEQKTLANVAVAFGSLAAHGVERGDVVVVLGGGVAGDLFGFVAASYLRGLRLLQIPTTVVAQVDSSIGGKVGVDLPEGKNLVGAFKHPQRVIIDYATLRTLSDAEWISGTAEVVKCGVIADADLFSRLEADPTGWRRRAVDLGPPLRAALAVKARVVREDELETGVRMILNYGHTLGHALEGAAGYRGLRHGEAVAWGMAMAARLAARVGLSNPTFVRRQDRLFRELGLLEPLPALEAGAVYERLFVDKKVRDGRLRWVLPGPNPGAVAIRDDLPLDLVRELATATVDGSLLGVAM